VEKSDEAPAGTLAASPGSSAGSSSQSATPESSNAAATAGASSSSPAIAAWSLRRDWQEAEQLVNEGKFKAALAKLSPHYLSPEVPSDQRTPLAAWLDALAAKVIYSREHLLAAPHHVRKGETLFEIADQYNVPWRLLANINSHAVSDPRVLVQGTELKVVPGPFRAHINIATNELTLFVSDLYAGRFPLSIGDQPPPAGQYKVVDKMSQQKTYYGLDGRVIPANEPSNPYGGWWISLGGDVSIHGSPATPETQKLGCLSLSPQDARDVYGILSMGSDVTIQR
jgi:lipoprotein-anchoring transpeptidase ErfK/SrfK